MGILTAISAAQADWRRTNTAEPPDGTYTFRGLTKQGDKIYQYDADENMICIFIGGDLVQISDIRLKDLQASTGEHQGGANFGLTQSANTVFSFNTISKAVTTVKFGGSSPTSTDTGTSSSSMVFEMPSFIADPSGEKYFPLNYWPSSGNVNYFSPTPPTVNEIIASRSDTYPKFQIIEQLTATDVRTYDNQKRTPDQSVIMGRELKLGTTISAREHLLACLKISSEPRTWHWCHLIAHSLRANELGQVAANLVAGTAGVNGAMLALEKAIKLLLVENETTIQYIFYEVEAHVINDTHIAKHIKATIGQDSWTYTHYMDATVPERELTSQTREFQQAMLQAYNDRMK